jgi:hypothetical protein
MAVLEEEEAAAVEGEEAVAETPWLEMVGQ